MKKLLSNAVAFIMMGVLFVTLNYLFIEKLGSRTRNLYLQDKTVNEMYNEIKLSGVNIPNLKFVLSDFSDTPIIGQFIFGVLLSVIIVSVYSGIIRLFDGYRK